MNGGLRGIKTPPDQCQASDPEILFLVDRSNYLSSRVALLPSGHLSFDPLHRADTGVALRAVLRIPLPLASAERIAASFVAAIRARPIGLPLVVPWSRALASPAWMRS